MTPDDAAEIEGANARFYRAFESLDIKQMDEVWAREEYVTCIHPGVVESDRRSGDGKGQPWVGQHPGGVWLGIDQSRRCDRGRRRWRCRGAARKGV